MKYKKLVKKKLGCINSNSVEQTKHEFKKKHFLNSSFTNGCIRQTHFTMYFLPYTNPTKLNSLLSADTNT